MAELYVMTLLAKQSDFMKSTCFFVDSYFMCVFFFFCQIMLLKDRKYSVTILSQELLKVKMLNHGSDVGAHCPFLNSGCGVESAVQLECVLQ